MLSSSLSDFTQLGGLALDMSTLGSGPSLLGSSEFDFFSMQPTGMHTGVASGSGQYSASAMEGNVNGTDPGSHEPIQAHPSVEGGYVPAQGGPSTSGGSGIQPLDIMGSGLLGTENTPMWPMGMEPEDWGRYLADMNEWTQVDDEPSGGSFEGVSN